MLLFRVSKLNDAGADSTPGLFLSDVLATSYHCVVDTGVKKGDIVGIWGAGKQIPICARLPNMRAQDPSVKCAPSTPSCQVHLV